MELDSGPGLGPIMANVRVGVRVRVRVRVGFGFRVRTKQGECSGYG